MTTLHNKGLLNIVLLGSTIGIYRGTVKTNMSRTHHYSPFVFIIFPWRIQKQIPRSLSTPLLEVSSAEEGLVPLREKNQASFNDKLHTPCHKNPRD